MNAQSKAGALSVLRTDGSRRCTLSSPHKPSVSTIETEFKKLLAIQHLEIPPRLFHHLSPKLEQKYRIRAATEIITELRSHPDPIRYTLLATLFSYQRGKVIDSLADLLDEITLKIRNRAKNTTRKEAIAELERVKGEWYYLYRAIDCDGHTMNSKD